MTSCLRGAATRAEAPRKTSDKPIPQIYTEWANHYLDRGQYKRHIADLQEDVTDGVLLADIIEAVTGMAVRDIVKKPKIPSQKMDNIRSCLNLLSTLGVNLDGIFPQDIRDGSLKTILSLFFNLSRFKQAQKNNGVVVRPVPPPHGDSKISSGSAQKLKTPSSIPAPAAIVRSTRSGLVPPSAGSAIQKSGVWHQKTESARPVSSRPSSTSSSSSIPHLPTSRPTSGPTMLDKIKGGAAGMARVESSSSLQSGDSRSVEGSERSRGGQRKSKPSVRSSEKPLPLKPKPNLKPLESRTLPKSDPSRSSSSNYNCKTAPDRRYRAPSKVTSPTVEENSGIPKPTATVRGQSSKSSTLAASHHNHSQLSRLPPNQNKPSRSSDIYAPLAGRGVAMVSPMVGGHPKGLNPITEGGGESPVDIWRRARAPEDEDNEEEMLVKPMQPLTYGYTRRLAGGGKSTMPPPTAGVTTLDGGYLSDGDVLTWPRLEDAGSGYVSEGGASLYARTRGQAAINVLQDDSSNRIIKRRKGLDDSSSLSSGISDTLADFSTDDNMTGSSSDYPRSHHQRSRYRYGPPGTSQPRPSLTAEGPLAARRGPPAGSAAVRKVKVCANTQTCSHDMARLSYDSLQAQRLHDNGHHHMRGSSSRLLQSKEEDIHGSALSLVSSASSIYSGAATEEKQTHEIRRLRKELDQARDKIHTLTAQLTTNAHVVAAFEQSLSNMTSRLQHLTATAEQKDSELHELRGTIEALKQQSAEAGLTKVALQSMQAVHKSLQHQQRMSRQLSADSVSSVTSMSSGKSGESTGDPAKTHKKKKKGWLRSSFSKAFTKSKKNKHGSVSDVEEMSVPNSPMLGHHHHHPPPSFRPCGDQESELRRQLREKDLQLTDVRLETLSSQHQLDTMREKLARLRMEVTSLRQENDRLRRRSESVMEDGYVPSTDDPPCPADMQDPIGPRIDLQVCLPQATFHVGAVTLGPEMDWSLLEKFIAAAFTDYLAKVDPVSSLGLSKDSIFLFKIGENEFKLKDAIYPEKSPLEVCDASISTIDIVLKGVESGCADGLAFETLIPKPILERYLALLTEHRRVVFCGPSGTGKTFLAQRLARHVVQGQGADPEEAVTTFSVEHKSAKELRQYLASLTERCTSGGGHLTSAVILDNLHQIVALGDVFNGFLGANHQACPYIIGTMDGSGSGATNLQLHHNFRWVLCANHAEPVVGLLGRSLRRKLLACRPPPSELQARVADWLPRVWRHLNRFLETLSSAEVTIGPRLFLACPVEDAASAQVWFTDVWNYSVVPYLTEAVRESSTPWEDPTDWVLRSLPWPGSAALLRLRADDVQGPPPSPAVSSTAAPSAATDPLLNMLMRLQEAASYATPHLDVPREEVPLANL